jgi:tetratricopeptide (TPR) repeat protein
LVQGFRAGELSLKRKVPAALLSLADPYDPAVHSPYPVLDMSYYKGKLYLYYGVTPAVLVFWPYVTSTGHYLLQKDAVVIFCLVGFLASAGLLWALWRRYFAEVHIAVVAAGTLTLGLATFTPSLVARSDVWEVAISCGHALTMLALAAIWKALHESERRCRWLVAASLAYGLAVGARPSLLFGAVILLVPVFQPWRERRMLLASLLAATVPITLIGLGLMLYNALRFDNPFEFGWHYVLAGPRRQLVNIRYLWFNFRTYFLRLARWSGRFPFVHPIAVQCLPAGYETAETYGVLTSIPIAWLALAVPMGWRGRSGQAWSVLRRFVIAAALLFGMCALPLGLYATATVRFEVDFLPALVLLALVGILSLERTFASQPFQRHAVRWGWSLLLGFSVAFNLLACVERCAEAHDNLGAALMAAGQIQEAIDHYEQAVHLNPDFAMAQYNWGYALLRGGRVQEAIGHYQQALRIRPNYAVAHYGWANALLQAGQLEEAIGHYEQALTIEPDFSTAHNNLGNVFLREGKVSEAIEHYEQALRIEPDYVAAHNNLAAALLGQRRLGEAIEHYEQVVRLQPDFAEAHYNLGIALDQAGRVQEAIQSYEQALHLNPDYVAAHNNLAAALMGQGRLEEAIGHYEQALKLQPDFADAHNDLGVALARAGHVLESIEQWELALRIKPDYVDAHNNLGIALFRLGRLQEAIGHYQQALKLRPDFASAHYNLGNALAQAGRVPEAIGHYQQALKLQPDFAAARDALARLQSGE